jgi:hypothetical protein
MRADPDATTRTVHSTTPPDPATQRRTPPLWLTTSLAVLLAASLGAVHGARVAFGAPLPPAVVETADVEPTGSLERDWRRGDLWRPTGSIATRPESPLRRELWRPAARNVTAQATAQPGTL